MKKREHLIATSSDQARIKELEGQLAEAQARIKELEDGAAADAEGYRQAVAELAAVAHQPRQFAKECICGNTVVGRV